MFLLLLACALPDASDASDAGGRSRWEDDPADGAPALLVEPFLLDFGDVAVGESATAALAVRNEGTATLLVDAVVEDATTGFSVGFASLVAPPGELVELPVAFAPPDTGDVDTRLLLTSNDPEADVVAIPLRGAGTGSWLRATPPTLDLGTIQAGCQAEGTLRLDAGGTEATVVSALLFDEPAFHAVAALPWTLEPGAREEIVVGFDGASAHDWTGVLSAQTERGYVELATVTALVVPTETARTTYTVPYTDRADIVVSVAEDVLAEPAGAFESQLATLLDAALLEDRRFAVVVGDDGCLPGGWIDDTTADPHGALTEMLAVPTGAETDMGLERLSRALTGDNAAAGGCNEGLLRDDAELVLIGLPARADASPHAWSDYLATFESLKADPDLVTAYAVAGDWPGGCGGWEAGAGWYELTVASAGAYVSLCATDWPDTVAELLETGGWEGDLELEDWPVDGTIVVTVDGEPSYAWTYADGDNALRFDEPWPAEGAEIVVTYGLYPDCD